MIEEFPRYVNYIAPPIAAVLLAKLEFVNVERRLSEYMPPSDTAELSVNVPPVMTGYYQYYTCHLHADRYYLPR
jgi:hypothetical protein